MLELALAALVLADPPGTGNMPWRRDHRAAYQEAQERGAALLVHFRSDHCARSDIRGDDVAVGAATTRDDRTDCDVMEETVWGHPEVPPALSRFVPVLADQTDQTLARKHNVITVPTTLFADPWGNEIVRLVHYVPRDRLLRIALALPADFAGLRTAGPALRLDLESAPALKEAAAFYEAQGLREIAELYYAKAAFTPAAKKDSGLRRALALARGTNLLRMGKLPGAARVFEAAFEDSPEGPQSDVVLFAWMMAEIQQGHVREAEHQYAELVRRFPKSPYTAKAQDNLRAARRR